MIQNYLRQCSCINNDDFIVIPSKSYSRERENGDGIYKLNLRKNAWIKIFDYDDNFYCDINSLAYDIKNKLLYGCDLFTYPSSITIFDLNTKNKPQTK